MAFSMCPYHQHYPLLNWRPSSALAMADQLLDSFGIIFEVPSRFLEEMHGVENRIIAEPGCTMGIISDQDKFRVELDVKAFKPEELKVKCLQDRFIVVEGKQEEEREEEEGGKTVMKQEFKRSYMIPKGVDVGKLKSNLANGVLAIEAPKKEQEITQNERPIAIEHNQNGHGKE